MRPTKELSGRSSMAWDRADLRKAISSLIMQVSTTNMNIIGDGEEDEII
jgi:hypothetical protein